MVFEVKRDCFERTCGEDIDLFAFYTLVEKEFISLSFKFFQWGNQPCLFIYLFFIIPSSAHLSKLRGSYIASFFPLTHNFSFLKFLFPN